MEEHGAMLDEITGVIADPAEVSSPLPCASPHASPGPIPNWRGSSTARVSRYLTSASGLAPRALRDLQRAQDAGRLSFDEPTVAIACIGGALMGVMHLGLTLGKPSAVDRASDQLAANLLRMSSGLPLDEAREVAGRKLPRTR